MVIANSVPNNGFLYYDAKGNSAAKWTETDTFNFTPANFSGKLIAGKLVIYLSFSQ